MGIDTQPYSLHTRHVKSKFLFSQWMWSKVRLRGNFRALALIGFLIWLSNFSIIFFEIHGINQTTLEFRIARTCTIRTLKYGAMKKILVVILIIALGLGGFLYYDWHTKTKKQAAKPCIL